MPFVNVHVDYKTNLHLNILTMAPHSSFSPARSSLSSPTRVCYLSLSYNVFCADNDTAVNATNRTYATSLPARLFLQPYHSYRQAFS